MWNPFKKSKEKQLKEIIASATLDYLKDIAEEETRNKLKNENVNDKKVYELLKSKQIIGISEMYNPRNVIGIINDYKHDIKRINNEEEFEFIIDGEFYIYPKNNLNNIETNVLIHIGDIFNNVVCYGKICSYLVNNDHVHGSSMNNDHVHGSSMNNDHVHGSSMNNCIEDIRLGLIIRVPIKELDLN